MQTEPLKDSIVRLITQTACDLSSDVEKALQQAAKTEQDRARSTLEWMLKNVSEARKQCMPICQDTGSVIFYVDHGRSYRPAQIEELANQAIAECTSQSILRPNAVDPLTGKNSGNNRGLGVPYFHFTQTDQEDGLRVRLMLKGGGSENCGVQYTLPDSSLQAGRDINGIKRCILDAVYKAQGFGCAPGVLGVGIGGDRLTSYMESKEQFFRMLDDQNPNPELAALETEMLEKVNQLGIGPMGFSGKTTLLGLKIGMRHRHPASFFVSVSYMCWACRRKTLLIQDGNVEI